MVPFHCSITVLVLVLVEPTAQALRGEMAATPLRRPLTATDERRTSDPVWAAVAGAADVAAAVAAKWREL